MMNDVDVFVTGAAGVLGREIVLLLRERGYRVMASGRSVNDGLDAHWDIAVDDQPSVDCAPRIVVHAAAMRGPYLQPLRETEPLFAANVMGTMRVARWCVARHVTRFVLISGALVYGEWSTPRTEDDPTHPWQAGPYAVAKWCAEGVASLVRNSGTTLSVLRLSSLYGQGYDVGLIQRLLREGRNTGTIKLSPPFDDAFDFLHVSDAARAVRTAVEGEFEGVLNLGSGVATSLDRLAGICADEVRANVDRSAAPGLRPGRILNWVNIERARREIGFVPKISLEQGISEISAGLSET